MHVSHACMHRVLSANSFELEGQVPSHLSAKDLILHIKSRFVHGTWGHAS